MKIEVQRKNAVNNVDMSNLRAPWQNGPYTHTEQHKNMQNTKLQQTFRKNVSKFCVCFTLLARTSDRWVQGSWRAPGVPEEGAHHRCWDSLPAHWKLPGQLSVKKEGMKSVSDIAKHYENLSVIFVTFVSDLCSHYWHQAVWRWKLNASWTQCFPQACSCLKINASTGF